MELTDIHSHVLPGIDDGSKDWQTTLGMLRVSYDAGVRRVIATPHYVPWKKPLEPARIRELCAEAMDRFRKEYGETMQIRPGEELYFHLELKDRLAAGEVLTLAGSPYILVEFATDVSWRTLRQGLADLHMRGYRPITAHAERYDCLRREDRLGELIASGIRIQMNAESLEGRFWDGDVRWCRKQVLDGKVHFVASDMHNLTSRPPLGPQNLGWLSRKGADGLMRKLLHDNSQLIWKE